MCPDMCSFSVVLFGCPLLHIGLGIFVHMACCVWSYKMQGYTVWMPMHGGGGQGTNRAVVSGRHDHPCPQPYSMIRFKVLKVSLFLSLSWKQEACRLKREWESLRGLSNIRLNSNWISVTYDIYFFCEPIIWARNAKNMFVSALHAQYWHLSLHIPCHGDFLLQIKGKRIILPGLWAYFSNSSGRKSKIRQVANRKSVKSQMVWDCWSEPFKKTIFTQK